MRHYGSLIKINPSGSYQAGWKLRTKFTLNSKSTWKVQEDEPLREPDQLLVFLFYSEFKRSLFL